MLVDAIVYSSRIAQLSDHPVALAEIKRWSKDLCAKLECFVVKGGVE
jgi:muramidase (phage lysozyme)